MPAITFLDSSRLAARPLRVHIRQDDATLRDIITDCGLFREFECEDGYCGSCAVKVVILRKPGEPTPSICLGDFERETLYGLGKLTRRQYASPVLAGHLPLWRLACQYRPDHNDIVVAL